MKIICGLETEYGLSLALGSFDGIHLGHAVVLKNTVKFAKENSVKSGVILFRNHPREYFSNGKFESIIELNDKLNMLSKIGIDNVYLLDFDSEIANMTAQEYFENIIIKVFRPSAVTTGFNHTFGRNGEGNNKTLEEYSKIYNFRYFSIPPVTSNNHDVSSSIIRQAVKLTDFDLAKDLLGYHFYIKSPVIHGRQIGRTINYPTANLIYPENIVKVPLGVYYVYVNTGGNTYRGIMNYGFRPTVDGSSRELVPEVHLLDFSGNLYGNIIRVSFVAKIRDEKKFSSLEKLKEQLKKDSNFAKNYNINNNQPKPKEIKAF